MAQIFISYSRVDNTFVEQLNRRIQQAFPHLKIWHDQSPHGLIGGDNWWEEILKAIAESDVFVYILSNESVESLYCQAEFTEARRLQKRIITIQARDKTELTDELDDIQFIDMKDGPDDPDALQRLNAAIYKQLSLVRKVRPLWKVPTPKPRKDILPARTAEAPDVETTPLSAPTAEQEALRVAKDGLRVQIGLGLLTLVVTLIVAFIGLIPWLSERNENANATQTAEMSTQLGSGSNASATGTSFFTPTVTPTYTETLEIAFIVQTLDADATLAQATQNIYSTAIARATGDAVGTQSIADQTATATLWTQTPTVDITASIEAYRTEQAATATQAWINNWTDTPTPTFTSTAASTSIPTLLPTPSSTVSPISPLSPEEIALTPVTSNAVWTPFERDFGGVPMVLVPVGCFMMGLTEEQQSDLGIPQDRDGVWDEQPAHEQCFDKPFWIDKYEVTQAQFVGFNGFASNSNSYRGDNHPRENVTWYEAHDFCEQRDAQLPTEREWEYAARGPDNLLYPWGDMWDPNNVVWGRGKEEGTAEVGSIMDGSSWIGALDLIGNVWEWVNTPYHEYPYHEGVEDIQNVTNRMLRGGSFLNQFIVRTSSRVSANATYWYDNITRLNLRGFRCTKSYN